MNNGHDRTGKERHVIFLPLEPLQERYTNQMLSWVTAALHRAGVKHTTVCPQYDGGIRDGQWLDFSGNVQFRAAQMHSIAKMFAHRIVPADTLFLVGDVWWPGIEQIKMMAELYGVPIRIAGWHYAGVFDPTDLLANSLSEWARAYERNLVANVVDTICVGSEFHKAQVMRGCGTDGNNIHSYGLAWRADDIRTAARRRVERQNIVAFPHRFAAEKCPDMLKHVQSRLAAAYPDWRFVFSTNNPIHANNARQLGLDVMLHKSKDAYYDWLATCKVWFSAATQETFGYSLHEALALELRCVAPAHACYPEMLGADHPGLYALGDPAIAAAAVRDAIEGNVPVLPRDATDRFNYSVDKFLSVALTTEQGTEILI